MTLKRIVLFILTVVTLLYSGSSLIGSLKEPQFQSKLELYQTNIVLLATEWQPVDDEENLQSAKQAILGAKPVAGALKQYKEARSSAKANLEKAQTQLEELASQPTDIVNSTKPSSEGEQITNASLKVEQEKLQQTSTNLQKLLAELDLRIGILQASQGKTATAIKNWQQLQQNSSINPQIYKTSQILIELW